ncbi:hypothetical protein MSPP1_003299 [Malassezia sp. CBS 17886]|nr:hypothetical protein MSPP1_003299 [Malassezia sp. CBS 17886]
MAPAATATTRATPAKRSSNGTPRGKRTFFSSFDVTDQAFYTTPHTAAIVNLKPVVPGHVLVLTRTPYKRLAEVPADELGEFFGTVQRVSTVVEKAFGGDSLSIAVQDGASAGQTVPHLHAHILPRRRGDIDPNDLVYEYLDRFGLELNNDLRGAKQMDSARPPRTMPQMRAESSWLRAQMDDMPARDGKLPVTLLSGFLGAGKTTLLRHILQSSDHGLRIAVIVNDMGELNIDSQLIAGHKLTQGKERLVEMTNGCVCCTLRGDLLEEVSELAKNRQIDYLVIESSGISEPMQVCETFSELFAEMHAQAAQDLRAEAPDDPGAQRANERVATILEQGGLPAVARLDTCCTVVDAANLFNDFNTTDFLVDRHDPATVPEEDDRNISDLMVDQIEFSDVIIVNKCDRVSSAELAQIKGVLVKLNPAAKILTATQCDVNLREVLNTNLFSYEKAATSAGWLRSLAEDAKPETEEYDVGSFVYRARRPFHPERLWHAIRQCFVVIQAEYMDDGEAGSDADSEGAEEVETMDEDAGADTDPVAADEEQPQLNPRARLASKKQSATWSSLLRSKGFVWLATRPLMFGEWSQAGIMLTLDGGSRWRCEVPESMWPDDPEVVAAIRRDFDPETPWGDRRQELVFIGTDMRGAEPRIRAALDECLLNDDEWDAWTRIMEDPQYEDIQAKQDALEQAFTDGFEDWVDMESAEHAHDHDHA